VLAVVIGGKGFSLSTSDDLAEWGGDGLCIDGNCVGSLRLLSLPTIMLYYI